MPLFFVSDYAYATLTKYAIRQGYIKATTTERANGMSSFLNALARSNFADTRPLSIKIRHEAEVKMHRAPSWVSFYNRRARQLQIAEDVQLKYIQIALSFNIISPTPFAVGGPSRRSSIPTTSLVLEGIGLNWITPVNLPLLGNSRV